MKTLLLHIALISSVLGFSQNLVPNGDFENYTACPTDHDQLYLATPWYSPNDNSTDYFNSCHVYPGVGFNADVPTNTHGYQEAHSGNGYMGFNFVPPIGYFEYGGVKLSQPLEAGQNYCVTFWVSLSDNSCWSTNMLGIHLTHDSLGTPDNHIDLIPTMQFPEIVTQKEEWVQMQMMHTAWGGEQYLTLGLFNDGGIEPIQFCNEPYAINGSYFYVDDVSIELMNGESACEDSENFTESFPNIITANNDGVNDYWEIETFLDHEIVILNRWGNVVYENKGTYSMWDAKDVVGGTYFYKFNYGESKGHGFIQVVK